MAVVFLSFFCAAQDTMGLFSIEAYQILEKPDTYLIDVRTIAEYVYVGHLETAFSVPIGFWDEKGITIIPNPGFEEDLKALFKPQDTLIFICRSGNRSGVAVERSIRVGFKDVFNIIDGFEGGKDRRGRRTVNGWKIEGLPYIPITSIPG